MTTPIRVVLADDHAMVRQALSQFLDEGNEIQIVGQAVDALQALELAATVQPSVIVLDYSMPGSNALSTIVTLRTRFPGMKIVMLTVHEGVHYALRALEAGAHGYVLKSAAIAELLDAIKAVSDGSVYISRKIAQPMLQRLCQPRDKRTGLEALTQREFEVLTLLGAGMSLKECAAQLKISASSVHTYRIRLVEKLKVNTTTELIRLALENDVAG